MIEVGRICVKTAGRDSNKKCVVVDIVDDTFVMIDGETRRKKANIKHLEPTKQKIDIKKGVSRADIIKEFKKLGIELKDTKPKTASKRPTKQRKTKKKVAEEPQAKK